jgi:hypothetical protein
MPGAVYGNALVQKVWKRYGRGMEEAFKKQGTEVPTSSECYHLIVVCRIPFDRAAACSLAATARAVPELERLARFAPREHMNLAVD